MGHVAAGCPWIAQNPADEINLHQHALSEQRLRQSMDRA
jgi:hypothetical protein